jgi:hypothetical protein
MELDPKVMQKFAWDIFHLTGKMRHMGYDLTTDKARNRGQYTISDIASSGDHKALRTDTDEFDEIKFHNALYAIGEVKDAVRKLNDSMEWWESQIVKASGQEPIRIN